MEHQNMSLQLRTAKEERNLKINPDIFQRTYVETVKKISELD